VTHPRCLVLFSSAHSTVWRARAVTGGAVSLQCSQPLPRRPTDSAALQLRSQRACFVLSTCQIRLITGDTPFFRRLNFRASASKQPQRPALHVQAEPLGKKISLNSVSFVYFSVAGGLWPPFHYVVAAASAAETNSSAAGGGAPGAVRTNTHSQARFTPL